MEFEFPEIMDKKDYLGLPPHKQEKYVFDMLKNILKRNKNGITISVVEKKTPFTRPTIIKHLERLMSAREGFKRKLGNTNVYFPNGSAIYPDKTAREIIEDTRAFKGTFINNNYGEFIFIEEEGNSGISGGSFMIKKEEFKIFKNLVNRLNKEV
ncbi:MAG: hypothetical protein U9O94_08975 [Nanoarchaeota archaeon]|nr:hypothetical protein [Nanoarchaeota archaeon]